MQPPVGDQFSNGPISAAAVISCADLSARAELLDGLRQRGVSAALQIGGDREHAGLPEPGHLSNRALKSALSEMCQYALALGSQRTIENSGSTSNGAPIVFGVDVAMALLALDSARLQYAGIRAFNRAVALCCGFCGLAPCGIQLLGHPVCAVEEIRRAANLGVGATMIALGDNPVDRLAGEEWAPVWRIMRATGTLVVLHPEIFMAASRESAALAPALIDSHPGGPVAAFEDLCLTNIYPGLRMAKY